MVDPGLGRAALLVRAVMGNTKVGDVGESGIHGGEEGLVGPDGVTANEVARLRVLLASKIYLI